MRHLIEDLRVFKLKNGKLPDSFTVGSIRNLYISIKTRDSKMSESTAEFLLYLFKDQELIAETIDLCENFHQLV